MVVEPSAVSRNSVFVAGGQPSITYVEREALHIERDLTRSLSSPNQIVSLAGPTKCGKTVLCRKMLGEREYVWIEGGQIKTIEQVWEKACFELNFPLEISKSDSQSTGGKVNAGLASLISASGSRFKSNETKRTYRIDTMSAAIRRMTEKGIAMVIHDFHYLDDATRTSFLRNIKGAVFNDLRVILLSVPHRAFEPIKAEAELTGRFVALTVPEWSEDDLKKIPIKGFRALNVKIADETINLLSQEAQQNPFLIQRLCWEICFDLEVDKPVSGFKSIPLEFDFNAAFQRVAINFGLPVYERLVKGPQSRKDRMRRPLKMGGDVADVYQAILLAIAETGPKSSISYEDVRSQLNYILHEKIPQKHEVTSALKHLSKISMKLGADRGIDWDESNRSLNISDPYLRFYLRWQIRHRQEPANLFSGLTS